MSKKVWIVMGSDSDLPQMINTVRILEDFSIPYEITIASAHRSTDFVLSKAKSLEQEGFALVIAAAGLAAHLPGVVAASTNLPVIGIPLESGPLKGQDALHSIVQMPSGVPVATVAINGTKNAALLAVQILSLSNGNLAKKFSQYKELMKEEVLAKNQRLQKLGAEGYLAEKGLKKS